MKTRYYNIQPKYSSVLCNTLPEFTFYFLSRVILIISDVKYGGCLEPIGLGAPFKK